MARLRRLGFAGAIYHLTGRGNDRQKVFFTDDDRELFLILSPAWFVVMVDWGAPGLHR